MPLYRGEENVSKNYQKLMDKGYSKKEATAIAIKVASRRQRDKKQEKKKHG